MTKAEILSHRLEMDTIWDSPRSYKLRHKLSRLEITVSAAGALGPRRAACMEKKLHLSPGVPVSGSQWPAEVSQICES